MFYFQLLESFNWEARFFSTNIIKEYDYQVMAASTTLEEMYMNETENWVGWNENSDHVPLTFLHMNTSFDLVKIYFL